MGAPAAPAEPGGPSMERGAVAALLGIVVVTMVLRVWAAPALAESIDGLHFVKGVEHYSVAEIRPHWPGYPLLIGTGKLLRGLAGGPAEALHLLSALSSSLLTLPLGLLTAVWSRSLGGSRIQSSRAGLTAALLWSVVPASWTTGTEILSDPFALCLAITLLWLVMEALVPGRESTWWVAAGILGGLLPGVRLSYVPFLAPLVVAAWIRRHDGVTLGGRPLGGIPLWVGGSWAAVVGVWLGTQLVVDGEGFLRTGWGHLHGHFSDWGSSLATDPDRLGRPYRFAVSWASALVGRRPWGLPSWTTALGLVALLWAGGQRVRSGRLGERLPLLGAGAYGVWVLAIHDVNLSRYVFPLVAISCSLAALGLPTSRWKAVAAVSTLSLLLLSVTVPTSLRHRELAPQGFRLARYVREHLDSRTSTLLVPATLGHSTLNFTPEFLEAGAPEVPVVVFADRDVANLVASLEAHGRSVYITEVPPGATGVWIPAARFCAGSFQEQEGFHEIWLFRRPLSGEAVPPSPPCDQSPPTDRLLELGY